MLALEYIRHCRVFLCADAPMSVHDVRQVARVRVGKVRVGGC